MQQFSKHHHVVANTIFMENEIITKLGTSELHSKDGYVFASLDDDVWKIAAFLENFVNLTVFLIHGEITFFLIRATKKPFEPTLLWGSGPMHDLDLQKL